MKTIREFICYHQKQIMRFEFTVSELHRKLKDLLRENNRNKDELLQAYENLTFDSFLMMQDIFESSNEFILNTLGRKDNSLRLTIKMVDEESTVDIYRNHEINVILNDSPYKKNTAFKNIIDDNEKYYINNDLEDSFKNGTYVNPRLVENLSWEESWKNYSNNESSDIYYNATLVIPMAITDSDIDKDSIFYKKYFQANHDGKISTSTRAIWGFICFDTKQKNYFTPEDTELAFIISDILSLYVVFYYNYIMSSKTVQGFEDQHMYD